MTRREATIHGQLSRPNPKNISTRSCGSGPAGWLTGEHGVTLPEIADAPRDEESAAWFPIPGMYGGFKYWLQGEGDRIMLICESWSRVVGGSGQRHETAPEGARLIEEGFA